VGGVYPNLALPLSKGQGYIPILPSPLARGRGRGEGLVCPFFKLIPEYAAFK